MERKLTLGKQERLKSVKTIESLLKGGKVVKKFPLLVSYSTSESTNPQVQALFSVSKRKQKLAVNRNRIKRILRESYRINKLSLYEFAKNKQISFSLMILQVDGREIPFKVIETKLSWIIERIIEQESKDEDEKV